MRDLLDEILAHHTGQPIERIHKDTDRDFVMSADEARGVRHHRRGDQPRRDCGRSLRSDQGLVEQGTTRGGRPWWPSSVTGASC